jgi:hypothetical protein
MMALVRHCRILRIAFANSSGCGFQYSEEIDALICVWQRWMYEV